MKTVLVVDDETSIRHVYGKLLQRQGFSVLSAGTADDANEQLKRSKVDLILLDINMPGINGETFSEVAKTFHRDIKIVVASVYPLDEQKNLISHAADYYDKSESLTVLIRKVRAALEGKPDNRRKKVLIIDDDMRVRVLFRQLLMHAGYFPIDAGDSQEIFDFLKKQTEEVDLVILDLAMPRISGMHYYEMIRRRYPKAQIIVSSVYTVEEQRMLVLEADAYHDKSEGNAVLLGKIRELLGGKGAYKT